MAVLRQPRVKKEKLATGQVMGFVYSSKSSRKTAPPSRLQLPTLSPLSPSMHRRDLYELKTFEHRQHFLRTNTTPRPR